MTDSPLVSIIIPCRNEERFIARVITDLMAQDYPHEKTEVLFMDGMSTDKTKQIIIEFASQHPWIEVFDNAKQIVPPAMNDGIAKSKGDVIMRMDAHASYPPDYISKLVAWLSKLNADNVGGIWITQPSADTLTARAIAVSLSHPFGVGNALFRIGIKEPTEGDTVPFGCYRKTVFDRIGLYDERLVRNQDIELNKRLKSSGGKIFLVPDVRCIYYARDTYLKLWKNNFKNGEWVVLTSYYTKTFSSLSLRHFVPMFFAGYILTCFGLILQSWLFLIPILLYVLLNILFAVKQALKQSSFMLAPALSFAFLTLHISYGAGSFYGLWRYITGKT